jgi:hypothetical protein
VKLSSTIRRRAAARKQSLKRCAEDASEIQPSFFIKNENGTIKKLNIDLQVKDLVV